MPGKPITNGTSALQRVITIEAKEQPQSIKLRVAAYARVSSPSEDKLHKSFRRWDKTRTPDRKKHWK